MGALRRQGRALLGQRSAPRAARPAAHAARQQHEPAQELQNYDAFRARTAERDHRRAMSLLDVAREQVFTCLRPDVRHRLAHLHGPEVGSGVLERVMRELNARTDMGGSRWSVAGLRDLVTLELALVTDHAAWASLQTGIRPPNAINNYSVLTAKFTLADATEASHCNSRPSTGGAT